MKLKPDETLKSRVFQPLITRAFADNFYIKANTDTEKLKEL